MIHYLEGNILESKAMALVNTVNLVGVMGKGIALQFKKQFPEARTCLVLHGNSGTLQQFYPDDYQKLMPAVDVWGFRSLAFQKSFEKRFGSEKSMFLCHSGIPEKYLEPVDKDFNGGVKHFAYVGGLLELKNVDITLKALYQVMGDKIHAFSCGITNNDKVKENGCSVECLCKSSENPPK